MAVGGDITEITYNHPRIGTGIFYPKSGEDSTYDPGGIRNTDDDAGIDGGGRIILTKNRIRWSFEVPTSWDQRTNEDELEVLNKLHEDPDPSDFTFTNINGVVFSASGYPVGDLKGNGGASTIALKFSGGGKLSKLV